MTLRNVRFHRKPFSPSLLRQVRTTETELTPPSSFPYETLLQDGYQYNNSKGTNKENTNLHWNSGVFCVVSISMSISMPMSVPAHVLSSIFVS